MTCCQFHGEIDCCDHAVGPRDAFAGDFKCGAVIGTGTSKGKTQRHVHTRVKRVQLQRDQALIVIYAQDRIKIAFNRTMEYCVR